MTDNLINHTKTERERAVVEMLSIGITQTAAANRLGISRRTLQEDLYRVRKRAEVFNTSPVGAPLAPPKEELGNYYVKGTSTLFDKDGNAKLQWVKTNIEAEALSEISKQIVEALVSDVKGKSPPVPMPQISPTGMMNMIVMGDPHFGLYTRDEAGNEFGLDDNIRCHKEALEFLLHHSTPAKECVILSVGDTLHADNPSNKTTRSGNVLDVDTDWYKNVRATVEFLKYAVDTALKTNETVTLINLHGNHDDYSSYCLNLILDAYYSNEPRVAVNTSESRFMYHTFGENLFGFTHGDTSKPDALESIMACDMASEWSRKHRYWHTGHIHHMTVREYRGVTVESHRTLVAADRWTRDCGYRSKKEMKLIVYHEKYGELGRNVVNPSLLADLRES